MKWNWKARGLILLIHPPDTLMSVLAIEFQQSLLAWYDQHGRKDLPWQIDRTPYAVWISEIMLQQTQVVTVIPYYQRFMARFPEVSTLAQADVDEVLSLWSGLGYYARARHLHAAARQMVALHEGVIPATLEELTALPGIGRSTAGAILSLGYGIRAAILDGNVKRVLSRYAELDGWPGNSTVSRELWRLSEDLTPGERVGDYNQAMMDLGATLCVKQQPACGRCPVQTGCQALQSGREKELPHAKPRTPLPCRTIYMLMLSSSEKEFFLEQRPPTGLWGGLWVFPEFISLNELQDWCRVHELDTAQLASQPPRRHSFSHYHLDYTPVLLRNAKPWLEVREGRFAWQRNPETLAIPAPVRRLLDEVGSS